MQNTLIQNLEAATALGWPAAFETRISGWRVFAGLGKVGRVNSCWPLAFDGGDIDKAIESVEAFYRARHLTPQFKVIENAAEPRELAARLKARGYKVKNHTAVMTTDQPLPLPDHDVMITPVVTPEFAAIMMQTGHDALDGQESAEILHRVPNPSAFGTIVIEGQIAAIGLVMFAGKSAGIGAMRTLPTFRQKGYARSILRAVSAKAREAGTQTLWLQVETDNPPAIALYEREGFKAFYHYETLRLG